MRLACVDNMMLASNEAEYVTIAITFVAAIVLNLLVKIAIKSTYQPNKRRKYDRDSIDNIQILTLSNEFRMKYIESGGNL